jgi:hypothetical protein
VASKLTPDEQRMYEENAKKRNDELKSSKPALEDILK